MLLNFKKDVATYCYLNQVLVNKLGAIEYYELVVHEEESLDVRTHIVTLEELNETIKVNADNNNNVKYDFKIDNGYLKCEAVPRKEMSSYISANKGNTTSTYAPIRDSIYELFLSIVKSNGYYVRRKAVPLLESEYEINDIVSFKNISFSNSTMSCFFRVKGEASWFTDKIIYMKDGKLKVDDFYFCVDKAKEKDFDKYNIEKVGTYSILNSERVLYKYTGEIPIYAYTPNTLRIFPSIIVRYAFNSQLYKSLLTTYTILLNTLLKTEVERTPDSHQREAVFDPDSKLGITFKSSCKPAKADRIVEIITEVSQTFLPKVVSGEMALMDVLRELSARKVPLIEVYIYVTVLDIFSKQNILLLDRIDYINSLANLYKVKKLFSDMYLYSLRTSLYISNQGLYPLLDSMTLVGSDVPYYAVLKRRVPNEY